MDSKTFTREESAEFCNKINLDDFNKIQPHGAVIVLNDNLHILFYSENTPSLLNVTHENLLNNKVTDFLLAYSQNDGNNIEHYLRSNVYGYKKLLWSSNRSKTAICTQVNRYKGNIILNIERISESDEQQDLPKMIQLSIASMSEMSLCETIESLCDYATRSVKEITGFDSVMVYKFDPLDYSGVVVGQTCEPDMQHYVGLHFPPNDVPKSVINNYITQPLRYIPTILEDPIKIVKCRAENDDQPLIGISPYRMVAPIHIKYLRNMNVSSATSIGISHNGKIWGLIACHSKGEKYLSINQRIVMSFIAYSLSSTIQTLEYKKMFKSEQELLQLQSDLSSSFSKSENLFTGLESYHQEFMKILNASGMVIFFQENITSFGDCPTDGDIHLILDWLKDENKPATFATRTLPEKLEGYLISKNKVAGLLAIRLTEIKNHYLLFFRREELETIEWAGNPNNVLNLKSESYSPRDSFDRYIETKRNLSSRWTSSDISSANFIRSIVTSRHLQDILKTQALHDPLTGLYNRLYLDQRLTLELQRAIRHHEHLSVMIADLDYFKKINDTYGHQGGDTVLVEFSKLLTSQLRGYDHIYRYGGEEFLIILPNTTAESAYQKGEALRLACQQLPITSNDKSIGPITVSIGVASYPDHADETRSLIAKADAALYHAKENGRNKITISTEKII